MITNGSQSMNPDNSGANIEFEYTNTEFSM